MSIKLKPPAGPQALSQGATKKRKRPQLSTAVLSQPDLLRLVLQNLLDVEPVDHSGTTNIFTSQWSTRAITVVFDQVASLSTVSKAWGKCVKLSFSAEHWHRYRSLFFGLPGGATELKRRRRVMDEVHLGMPSIVAMSKSFVGDDDAVMEYTPEQLEASMIHMQLSMKGIRWPLWVSAISLIPGIDRDQERDPFWQRLEANDLSAMRAGEQSYRSSSIILSNAAATGRRRSLE